jgi:hypothetical protein
MAETKVVNLEVKTNAESVKKQFAEAKRELQEMAAAFGENSTQAIKAAEKAAKLKDVIDDSAEAIKNLQGGGAFSALSNSLGGVASGFTAVQGAMGLVGVESEKVQETLLKVQSAMALSEGLRGLEDLGRSFGALKGVIAQTAIGQKLLNAAQVIGATVMKALNFVMKQNPIFLIIAGITAAVAAFKFFTQSTDSATLAQEELNRKQEDSIRLMKQSQTEIDNYTNKLNTSSKNKIALAKAEGANSEEIFQLEKARLEEEIRYRKLMHDSGVKLTTEQYAQQKQAKFDLQILEAQHKTDLAKIEEEKTAKEKEENKKRVDNKKDENEKKRALDEAAFNEKQAKRIAQQAQDAQDLADAIKFEEDKHKAEVEALQKSADARKEANEKIVADNKARVEKEIADERALTQSKLSMASDALSILSDAVSLFGTKNEKDARNQFKINKALSLSLAIVNTARAVTAALATTNPLPGGRFIEAGIAAASGGVSIAKIAATQFSGGGGSSGGSGGGSSTNSSGGGGNNAQIQAPSFNIVGNNGLNQLSQLKQAPVQAYVVSGAMSTAQSLDRNRVRNATL